MGPKPDGQQQEDDRRQDRKTRQNAFPAKQVGPHYRVSSMSIFSVPLPLTVFLMPCSFWPYFAGGSTPMLAVPGISTFGPLSFIGKSPFGIATPVPAPLTRIVTSPDGGF